MTTKRICDKCESERDVRRVKAAALGENIDQFDKVIFEKDLCSVCRAKLSAIIGKFMNNDEIVFER